MNNTGWQRARERAAGAYREKFDRPAPEGLRRIRVHDLKRTFGRRLRAAGVGFETRQALLGHHNGSVTTHYSAAEIAERQVGVNRINATRNTPAMTCCEQLREKSHAKLTQRHERKRAASLQPFD